jgi:imidazoleglycerol phosphate dehydratase HisB
MKSPSVYTKREEHSESFNIKTDRRAVVQRSTSETDITVRINLDGTGRANIRTGIGFFDHMLHQIARHGLFDLDILATGDLYVDPHHTIEDTAITMGKAFRKALGDKAGIERYGFALPMDDANAEVLIDFGGRIFLKWKASFELHSQERCQQVSMNTSSGRSQKLPQPIYMSKPKARMTTTKSKPSSRPLQKRCEWP